MQQLVSIIIPSYNAAPWLEQTLQSALAQTWPNTEIILVDDGSKDDSLAIARRFETKGVVIVAQENRGASAARNHGMRLAHGAFFQFLDADDLLDPEKISQQMAIYGKCGATVALSSKWTRFTRTVSDADYTEQVLCRDFEPVDWVVTKFENNAMMHPAAWLISRQLADRAGPWDETLSLDDDGEFFTRVVLASGGIRYCPAAVSFYRSSLPGSLSRRKSDLALDSALRSLELSSALLLRSEDSPRTRKASATAFQQFIFDAYPRANSCRRRAAEKVAALGGSELKPLGGPRFRAVSRLLGWRLAKRLLSLSR
jgi:glycosyltransferase involved in cell wall biosynthesis